MPVRAKLQMMFQVICYCFWAQLRGWVTSAVLAVLWQSAPALEDALSLPVA